MSDQILATHILSPIPFFTFYDVRAGMYVIYYDFPMIEEML